MSRDRGDPQAVGVDNLCRWRLQVDGEIDAANFFIRSERFLIFPGAALFEEKAQEAGGTWEHASACRTEDGETNCRGAGRKRPGLEESRQVAAMVDVQVR